MVLSRRAPPTEHSAHEGTQLLVESSHNAGSQKQRHLVWEELPPWMRDNQFILGGYRQPTNSFRKCFASWLYLHNETGNIVTHLVGALVFLVLCFTVTRGLLLEFATIDWLDIVTLYAFLLGAVGCMGLSTLFHTVTCHSNEVNKAYNKCDYVGIVFLIVGSCVPVIYYMFYCHPQLKIFYLALIFGLGAVTTFVVVAPQFGTPEYRPLRAVTFVALGMSGIVPAIHSCIMLGWEYTMNAVQIPYMLMMGLTYMAGATIYGSRIPERWWPGRFDYWLHSHQILHMLVVAAAGFHYAGVTGALRWTHSAGLMLCSA
ncbi:hypothetical protein H4R24_001239 [Coemansia sp. RSA 988]|nr:hypothetical protein H4R24_001239 [Coemansia sp. RSA 988]